MKWQKGFGVAAAGSLGDQASAASAASAGSPSLAVRIQDTSQNLFQQYSSLGNPAQKGKCI